MNASFDLPIAWASVAGLAVFAFVLLDGFDLVIGALLPILQPHPVGVGAMDSLVAPPRRRTRSRIRRFLRSKRAHAG